jgi:hypothetical protein
MLYSLPHTLGGSLSLLAAQAEVTEIVKDLRSIQKSDEVQITRASNFKKEPMSIGAKLDVGDSFKNTSGKPVVELKCLDGTIYIFREKFEVVLITPIKAGCAVDVSKGSLNVLADRPTEVNVGGVHLGSEGTSYWVDVDSSAKVAQRHIAAFEGRVTIAGAEAISQGTTLTIKKNNWSRGKIDINNDVQPTAIALARLDAARVRNREISQQAFSVLKENHAAVLVAPDNHDQRLALVQSQLYYGIQDGNVEYQRRWLEDGASQDKFGPTAVLAELRGNVTIRETGVRRGAHPEPRRAQFLQIVRAGDEVNLPAEAGAGFVCSTDRWVEVNGNKSQRLTEDLCRSGKSLPPGTYRKLAPGAGRLRSIKNALVLEGDTRNGDEEDSAVPILVSPRNTTILEARPTLLWTPVSEATDYAIDLTGPKPFKVYLDASSVDCTAKWGDVTVCTLPYPDKEPDLPPGTISFLAIHARRGIAAPLREEAQPGRLKRLAPDKAEEIRRQLERLGNLPLDEQSRQLLAADIYAQEGLFTDAISSYRRVLATRDTPEVRVTLGDILLKIGLLRPAARLYQEVLDRNPGVAVTAAAEFGIGRVEYARRSFDHAESYFRKARDLYSALGLKEEAEAAERGAEEARRKRLPA